jgi:DNA repair photolyase
VAFSLSNTDPALKRAFEPYSPGLKLRLKAMEALAQAGVLVGTALMPIIPLIGDDESYLEDMVRATKDHGGTFVLAGGLTLEGPQAERMADIFQRLDPVLAVRWRRLYNWQKQDKPNYAPPRGYSARLGLMVRELCVRHGLKDRIPRYIPPGSLTANKRIAERLFLKTYDLELEQAEPYRIWAYRKAAWTVDEWPESIALPYEARAEAGLRELPGIGQSLAGEIAGWLRDERT